MLFNSSPPTSHFVLGFYNLPSGSSGFLSLFLHVKGAIKPLPR